MVDIKFIRENQDKLKEAIKNKNITLNLDDLLAADKQRVELLFKIENMRKTQNDLNDQVVKAGAEEKKAFIRTGKELKEEILKYEAKFAEVNSEYEELMVKVPTIPSPDTPVGKGDGDNVEIYRWGEPKKFAFKPKDHIELGKSLDILDLEKGTKVGGFRGYYVKNEGVLIVMGLMMYAVKKMVSKGYKPMIPPTLVRQFALFGSGYFKGLEY